MLCTSAVSRCTHAQRACVSDESRCAFAENLLPSANELCTPAQRHISCAPTTPRPTASFSRRNLPSQTVCTETCQTCTKVLHACTERFAICSVSCGGRIDAYTVCKKTCIRCYRPDAGGTEPSLLRSRSQLACMKGSQMRTEAGSECTGKSQDCAGPYPKRTRRSPKRKGTYQSCMHGTV